MIDPETGFPDNYVDPSTAQHLRWRGNEWIGKAGTYMYQQKVDAAKKVRDRRERAARGRTGFREHVEPPESPPKISGRNPDEVQQSENQTPNPALGRFRGRGG